MISDHHSYQAPQSHVLMNMKLGPDDGAIVSLNFRPTQSAAPLRLSSQPSPSHIPNALLMRLGFVDCSNSIVFVHWAHSNVYCVFPAHSVRSPFPTLSSTITKSRPNRVVDALGFVDCLDDNCIKARQNHCKSLLLSIRTKYSHFTQSYNIRSISNHAIVISTSMPTTVRKTYAGTSPITLLAPVILT